MSSGNYLDICSLDTLYPNIIICFQIGKNESISVMNNVNSKIDYGNNAVRGSISCSTNYNY